MSVANRAFDFALLAIAVLAIGWSAWELLHGRWVEAAALAGVAATAAAAHRFRNRLPPFFGLLLALAALLNTAGYVLTLWHQQSAFDEAMHAFTSFAAMAAIGWALSSRTRMAARPLQMVVALLATGILLGAAWELFEWAIGIVGPRRDTLIDLAMDLVGTAAAAALISRTGRGRR